MTQQIRSDDIMQPGTVAEVAIKTEALKAKAAIAISSASLLIGTAFLATALYIKDAELKAWASGLISLVVGAAIGFVFGNNAAGSGK